MNERMNEIGAFCETYGNTIPNRILEYLMENEDLDFAVGDMAKELEISKPKAYEIIGKFEKNGYLKKSRIVGKTQLYILNKENSRVKLFLNDFKECLRIVVEENSEESLCENIDGDTFIVSRKIGKTNVVRLAGINAPEKYQFGGKKATNRLRGLIGGKTVTIVPVGTSYNRVVANVRSSRKSINKRLR